jgi:hypothetical protein
MVSKKNSSPDFFEDHWIDPVATATGHRSSDISVRKKKAGFYLNEELLQRFTRKFHELKLAGMPIENKSALLELALIYALDDIDKGEESCLLKQL